MNTRRVQLGDLTFNVVDEGEGHPVVLLHGFPDSSRLWRHQIPVLVERGFRVIAPDLRGCGESSRPEGVEHYSMRKIVNDVAGILTALSLRSAHVVGHDWGAAVAWTFASLLPRRVDQLVAISVGHPAAYLQPTLAQREKSWYVLLYQFEGAAERLLRANNWRLFKEMIAGEGDADRYVADLSRPGALTAGLNWYRANWSPAAELETGPRFLPITSPTLAVWSSGDRAMLEEGVTRSAAYVKGPWRYERIEGATHWVPLDAADELNALLVGFLDPDHQSTRGTTGRKAFSGRRPLAGTAAAKGA